MDIASFLATVANNFKSKYLNLAQEFSLARPPILKEPTTEPAKTEPTNGTTVPVDTFEPSDDPIPGATDTNTTTSGTKPTTTPTIENPVEQRPDGTYYYQRRAQLDYKLDLRFDLGAITQTVEKLSEGETDPIEQFTAAGFGMHADFDLRGIQKIRTNMAELTNPTRRHQLTIAGERQAGQFAVQNRDFALKSFYDQATRVHRSLNESARADHRRAINRFAVRFSLDHQFSFAHLQRFNIQTERVSTEVPDALTGYVNSAGEVAANGTNDMMATFFDAVDSYLDDAEQAILDKVTTFFDQAAEELGFSGAMVEQARDQLTGSIESFFDRVDSAMAQLETRFAPAAPLPDPEPVVPPVTDIDPVPEPEASESIKEKHRAAAG